MTSHLRGAIAALLLSGLLAGVPAAPARANDAPAIGSPSVLQDGLTAVVRKATGSGAVALEIWIRCPSDGWSASQPGIARVAAFATVAAGGDASLRQSVRSAGGQLSVSVFQSATEIAVLAPVSAAAPLEAALLRRAFHPVIDAAALDDAKTRLAEQQAAAAQSSDALLRDGVFSSLFASGPLHDSTFGSPQTLQGLTLDDVRKFAEAAYVPPSAITVVLGNIDVSGMMTIVKSAAPPAGATAAAAPASQNAVTPAGPVALEPGQAEAPGVALAWVGPPISDQRAATAMDFLSDYLADAHTGVLAGAAGSAVAGSSFGGQFITLANPGIFFVSVSGGGVDPATMARTLQSALRPVLDGPLSQSTFAQALAAYESRLLRQMDSPQGLADNYGWYFAEGALPYAPSATDASLGGPYFENAASLTPSFVHDVARRYLGVAPFTIVVTPNHTAVSDATGGTTQ